VVTHRGGWWPDYRWPCHGVRAARRRRRAERDADERHPPPHHVAEVHRDRRRRTAAALVPDGIGADREDAPDRGPLGIAVLLTVSGSPRSAGATGDACEHASYIIAGLAPVAGSIALALLARRSGAREARAANAVGVEVRP